ncbi:glucoamylase family protein [Sphingomonas rubra]|nr:glucoamylase family protein [Sphingomonas rubra]
MLTRRTLFASATAALAAPALLARTPDPIVELEERTFRFFWDTTDARTGLAPDRWPTPSFASIAAIGFALTAYPIGVVNGWVNREAARDRTLATLRFLWDLPQGPAATGVAGHKGFFYHFLDMTRGHRFARCELSTIDTALLMAGVLFAGTWFDRADSAEREIRELADRLYARVDWRWAQDRADDPRLSMGWHPETGFIARRWNGYTEAMLLYVLALGSPSHAVGADAWTAWCATYPDSWRGQGTARHLAGAPHFWHQYSHVWIDFRGIRDAAMRDAGFDYFENSRRATRAQRDYAIRNPGGWAGYGENVWGLTACDGPGDLVVTAGGRERRIGSYGARGPVGFPDGQDDGTLAATAVAASLPFAPELVEPALATIRQRYGAAVWSRYGFLDSFHPTLTDPRLPVRKGRVHAGLCWVDDDYLGIDQGPIVAMIENARSGLVWSAMRDRADIRRGLRRAGFTGGWLS